MASVPRNELGILHLLAPARYGGLERVVRSLARGQSVSGHRVWVAAVAAELDDVAPFLSWFRDEEVCGHHIEVADRAYLRERRLVRDLCSSLRPNVVHTHGYRSDVIDSGMARALGIPTVTTVHGFTGNGLKGRLYEWLQRRSHRSFDAVIAVAKPQIPLLRASGVPGDLIHLIPNALDPDIGTDDPRRARERLGVEPGVLHIGWVGRLSPEKGPDVLVDALAHLRDHDFLASVIGDGPLETALARQARDLGIADRILWHGAIPDAATVFPAFDVLALSSRSEGTPMVLFEAIHAGIPVVATRVGGIPDVVSSDEALLVDPEDPAALAAALDDVLRYPDRARTRARAARDRVHTNFEVDSWVKRYDRVYREVTNR